MTKRKSLLALIGTVILLLSLAVPMMQCAPAAEEEVTPPPEEGEIKYGGRLTAGLLPGEMLETMRQDSNKVYTSMGCVINRLLYDLLWAEGPAPDYAPLPRFANSWETEDHITWRLHLRDDILFHDGVPATAEDVKFTFEYLVMQESAFLYTETDWESIDIIDDYTMDFTMKTRYCVPGYPPLCDIPILPKHIWEPYKEDVLSFENDEAIGSGKYKLREFKPSEHIWVVANEDHWEGRPYLDEIVISTYGSQDALYMALKNGEIDMIASSGCTALAAEDFRKTENVDVFVTPGLNIHWLVFNLHNDTPLQDVNVRKAIMYGTDKDRIIDMVYLGYAERADSIIYPELPEHNPNLPQYDHDSNRANEILDGAGYMDTDGDGVRNDPSTGENLAFELMVDATASNSIKAATLIKEQLEDVGIDISVEVLDLNTFLEYIYSPKEDLYEIGMSLQSPSPVADWAWESWVSENAPGGGMWNESWYQNPKFDEILYKMRDEMDMEKHKEYAYELQMMLAEDLPVGFLWRPNMIDPVRTDRLEGWVESMGGLVSWINPWTHYYLHLK